MKKIVYIIIASYLLSCNGQTSEIIKIDASKVKEIILTNKVDCSFNKLQKREVIITNKNKIESIIDSFIYMQPIQDRGNINMKINNGFFEMSFNEGDLNHYYTIHYTVYDGVIIWSNNGGKLFKNDRLEIAVYKNFIE